MGKPASSRSTVFETVRRLALALPGAEEGSSYGTPAFKVRGKLFARLHQDGESLVLRCEPEVRGAMMAAKPDLLFLTDHYRDYPWVLLRFEKAPEAELTTLLEEAHACATSRRKR